MHQRGIRGATTIETDTKDDILSATRELLDAILASNPGLKTDDIAAALFTVTDDIASAYPALAARQMGWDLVPMMCAREIPVKGSLPLCIRVLIHWNTNKQQSEIKHVYLRNAVQLRPDLVAVEKVDK
ncbi:MAG: chorismate mutase [Chloroflexi bacterium RIFOXYC12_FULL_59_14]|nr:MAG: chorismate mutase [Chloroflexi bacterium RIFOXYC12_FULL_59_14]